MSATQQPATGNSSFVQRALTAIIRLGTGAFGNTGQNTVTLSGLRASASIHKGGWPSFDVAEMRIYGVQPSVMNAVSTLGIPIPMVRHGNSLTIQAGDAVNGMATVFNGYIQNAWQNFDGMPDTMLQLVCYGGADLAVFPAKPISFPGGADVATIMSGLADAMGLAFENNGVQVQLASPYFAGTALQQAQKCAKAANIEMQIDTGTAPGTLAIWPKTGTRGGTVPLISKDTGLIGYPRFRDQGMEFSCIFNPNIRVGGKIKMQSSAGTAGLFSDPAHPTPDTQVAGGPNGLWYVCGPVTHDLAALIPGGPWFTEVSCARTVVPQS